jgi:hypothetical protein
MAVRVDRWVAHIGDNSGIRILGDRVLQSLYSRMNLVEWVAESPVEVEFQELPCPLFPLFLQHPLLLLGEALHPSLETTGLVGSYSNWLQSSSRFWSVLVLPSPELFAPVLDDAHLGRYRLHAVFDGRDHHELLAGARDDVQGSARKHLALGVV